MNENKRGSPFEFPHSFMEFAAFLKTVQLFIKIIAGCFESIITVYTWVTRCRIYHLMEKD